MHVFLCISIEFILEIFEQEIVWSRVPCPSLR